MADSTRVLAEFDRDFTPQKPAGSFRSGLDTVADGDYAWTILSAEFRITTKSGDSILSLEVRNEGTAQVVEKAYFLRTQQNVNILGGDLEMLGFDVGNWKPPTRAFSIELDKAIPQLRGRRFQGTKKTVPNRDKPHEPYHNLYINARLDNATQMPPQQQANGALRTVAPRTSAPSSEIPF
jgi:hypothetical protein